MFPTTPILDDFNRADNVSNLGSGAWTGDFINGGWPIMGISSNQMYPQSAFKSAYWTNQKFGPNQEVYATFPVAPVSGSNAWVEMIVRGNSPNTASYNGYLLRGNTVSIFAIRRDVGGVETTTGGSYGTMANGDGLGIEANGNVYRFFQFTAGAWTLLGTVTDSLLPVGGGYVGLAMGNEVTQRADNFGGGNIEGQPTTVPHVVYMRQNR